VDDIDLAHKIKRVIEDRRGMIKDTMMDGLLTSIEHYKSLQGELTALNLVEFEISEYFKER
tara:strand:- start:59 stop:241 length:183 start_codon:yes stop_codon:yes gene_type:complete